MIPLNPGPGAQVPPGQAGRAEGLQGPAPRTVRPAGSVGESDYFRGSWLPPHRSRPEHHHWRHAGLMNTPPAWSAIDGIAFPSTTIVCIEVLFLPAAEQVYTLALFHHHHSQQTHFLVSIGNIGFSLILM